MPKAHTSVRDSFVVAGERAVSARRRYVLVTPVRDEAATIGRTIRCVVGQTVRPVEWVIVDDGSKDGTTEIVRAASEQHGWIRIVSVEGQKQRSFAAVVHNTELGIRSIQVPFDFIGLLDGDLEFQSDYFERLISIANNRMTLGILGGAVIDLGKSKTALPRNLFEVPGAVQFLRRECLESLGGFVPIPEGGWDCITCAVARMNGFETSLITDLIVDHLKPRNVANGSVLRRALQLGTRDYAIGYLPAFEFLKCLARIPEYPLFAGAAATFLGFCISTLRARPRVVPDRVVRFLRREQTHRLKELIGLQASGSPASYNSGDKVTSEDAATLAGSKDV